MGMLIDKAIAELELLKKNTFSYMSAHQAFITAIETMRKYQKITEIVEHYRENVRDKVTNENMEKILEVVEDGSENNHHASNT